MIEELSNKPVPSFLSKVFDMLESNNDSIGWNKEGSGFVILNNDTLTNDVLPTFFKHKNYNSFLRQLNMYGFKKHKDKSGLSEFSHQWFRRGCRNNLSKIKRRNQEDINRTFETLTKDFSNESYLVEHDKMRKIIVDMSEKQKLLQTELQIAITKNISLRRETQDLFQKCQHIRNVSICKFNKLLVIISRLPCDAKFGKFALKKEQIIKRLYNLERNPQILNNNNFSYEKVDSMVNNSLDGTDSLIGRSPLPVLFQNKYKF